ncbi:MAG: hypothetical protein RR482_02940 [Clostridia bacterium]
MPPRQKAAIKAVRDMVGAIASSAKRAQRRMEAAEKQHGPMSKEYYAAKGGYDEAERMLKALYCTLDKRLYELEGPFRRSIDY